MARTISPEAALRRHSRAIAKNWGRSLAASGSTPAETLAGWAEEIINLLLLPSLNSGRARAMAAELARLYNYRPEPLGQSLALLADRIAAALPPEQAAALQPRLAALLGELTTGFLLAQTPPPAAIFQARQRSDDLFRLLFDLAPIGMSITDLDGNYLAANQAHCRTLGYSQAEMLRLNFKDITLPDDLQTNLTLRARALRGEIDHFQMEKRYVTRRGRVVYSLLHVVLVRDEQEQPLHFIGQVVDITRRKEAEEALKEREESFRALARNANDGIVVVTGKGNIIYVNERAAQITGYSQAEFLRSTVADIVHPDELEMVLSRLRKRLEGKPAPAQYETAIIHKKGHVLPVEITASATMWYGHPADIVVVRDISRRKQAEEEIRRHNEELEQLVRERMARIHELEKLHTESEKLAATGRMAARVAHEINNPLAGIKNAFLLVKDAIPASHPYYDYVGRIETEIDRIARIVRQMFDLYRPNPAAANRFQPQKTIDDIVALLETERRKYGVTISVTIDSQTASLPPVEMPEDLVRQVLYNIIHNAIEASPRKGRVQITAGISKNNLQITVADEGCGIPPEASSRIFEPFYTTKGELSRAGLGLGLSISKNIIDALGGALTFESRVGAGTTFYITLPAGQEDESYG